MLHEPRQPGRVLAASEVAFEFTAREVLETKLQSRQVPASEAETSANHIQGSDTEVRTSFTAQAIQNLPSRVIGPGGASSSFPIARREGSSRQCMIVVSGTGVDSRCGTPGRRQAS